MENFRAIGRAAAGLVACLGAACLVLAAEAPSSDLQSVGMEKVAPQWNVGDQWVVETSTLPIQVRDDLSRVARSRPVSWEFRVEKIEKIQGEDCYRVAVRCLLSGPPQPKAVLWVDAKTHTLRQLQTQVPFAGQFRTLTENYQSTGGQKSPVLAPLTALPVDLPLFQGNRTKGLEKFGFEVNTGPAGAKAAGDLGFTYEVEQDISRPGAEQVKGLLPETYTKDLDTRPVVEVRLRAAGREVRQFWQAGLPWPVYADNGTTISRLVKVTATHSPAGN